MQKYKDMEKEKIKMRLAKKLHEENITRVFLKNCEDWLRPEVKLLPEVGDWVEAIGMFSSGLTINIQRTGRVISLQKLLITIASYQKSFLHSWAPQGAESHLF
jgi:hypothetical protein